MLKILVIVILLTPICIYSQIDPTWKDYFPHHLGDMWEYFVIDGVGNDTIQDRIILDSVDEQGFSHLRSIRRNFKPYPYPLWYDQYRIDTMGQVWAQGGYYPSWRLLYKLDAQPGEIWIVENFETGFDIAKVGKVYEDSYFGISTLVKEIGYYATSDTSDTTIWLSHYGERLASGFGTISRGGGDLGYLFYLRGAYINGQLFGDTTVVGVRDWPGERLPTHVQLFQNYPNPFNHSTTIIFEIPRQSRVTVRVFDILGREVQSILNSLKSAGKYNIAFNTRELPSGTYFYRLETAEVFQTNKMILEK